jgi:ribonuclease HI
LRSPAATLIVNIDGAARGNPGPAAIGVVVATVVKTSSLTTDDEGTLSEIQNPESKIANRRVVATISERIGDRTNNQAEYEALLAALEKLTDLRPPSAVIRTDSELLYYQMIGSYRVKNPALAALKLRADQLLRGLRNIRFEIIPREENRAADRLANLAFKNVKPVVRHPPPVVRRSTDRRSRTPDHGPSLFDED